MKIRKFNSINLVSQTKVQLINSNLNYLDALGLDFKLKRTIKLIYKFHRKNCSILFTDVPYIFQSQHLKTNHMLLPENSWVEGVLANKSFIFKFLKKMLAKYRKEEKSDTVLKCLLEIKNLPDIIVTFDRVFNETLISEAKRLEVPIILIQANNFDTKLFYKIIKTLLFYK